MSVEGIKEERNDMERDGDSFIGADSIFITVKDIKSEIKEEEIQNEFMDTNYNPQLIATEFREDLSLSQKIEANRPFVCEICNKSFRQKKILVGHLRIHTGQKPYACDLCPKKFSLLSILTAHKRTHTGEKPYECDMCDSAVSSKRALIEHKRIHTGEKPYSCDICHKLFALSSNLVRHKRIHSGIKPYSCDICEMKFSANSALNDHKRTHTGVKPYKCDICENAYAGRSGLLQHKRFHTGDKPYSCEICNKLYSHSSLLSRHIKTPAHLKRMESAGIDSNLYSGVNYNAKRVEDVKEDMNVANDADGFIITAEDIQCEIKEEQNIDDL